MATVLTARSEFFKICVHLCNNASKELADVPFLPPKANWNAGHLHRARKRKALKLLSLYQHPSPPSQYNTSPVLVVHRCQSLEA